MSVGSTRDCSKTSGFRSASQPGGLRAAAVMSQMWERSPSAASDREYGSVARVVTRPPPPLHGQGLTLVHFSPQLERFLWDRGGA